jgi:hypothetical protein
MSNLKYAILEEEFAAYEEGTSGKPHLVETTDTAPMTRRVEAALDVDFANGSMPA